MSTHLRWLVSGPTSQCNFTDPTKSNVRSITLPVDTWIDHTFKEDDLLGGFLNLHILSNFASAGVLSVHLSALTLQKDPEPFIGQDDAAAMDLEAARWMNLEYQEDMLGVTLAQFLEDDYFDADDDDNSGNYPDFLGGESLEEYYEHS